MDNSFGDGGAHGFEAGPGIPAAGRSWGPDRRLRWLTLAIALGGLVWLLLDRNSENRIVAAAAAVFGLAVFAVLTRVRIRLAADGAGLTIRGPLRAERVGWDEIAAIATPLRGRFGRRAASLEIEIYDDTLGDSRVGKAATNDGPGSALGVTDDMRARSGAAPDTRLVVFGSLELGADPAEVGRMLRLLKL